MSASVHVEILSLHIVPTTRKGSTACHK